MTSDPVTITLLGQPLAWARSRGANRYTPEAQRDYQDAIRFQAIDAMRGRKPLEGPLMVHFLAEFQIPPSWSKAKMFRAIEGEVWHTAKPDLDNLLKIVCDAVGPSRQPIGGGKFIVVPGIVYRDDAQICRYGIVCKRYGVQPKIVFTVSPIDSMVDRRDTRSLQESSMGTASDPLLVADPPTCYG